jgi:pyruvate dehydrogenase (quinone)
MTGMIGFGMCYEAIHECDLLILLGTDFPYDKFLPTKTKIAQIDIRVDHLGRRSRLDLGIWGDVRETLQALLPMVSAKSDREYLDTTVRKHKEKLRKMNVYVDHVGKRTPMHPEPVAATLSELAAPDAIFTVDTGMCNVWSARHVKATKGRRIIGSFNHGSMANALPQSIGAQCAFPGRQVIALCGDGGFAMSLGDILTITQYNLPIKLVVFDNSALGMVKLEMETAGMPDFQTDLKNPNFAKMAEAIGIMGVRIENPADLSSGIKKALEASGPALIDVVTDANALSIPSHADRSQAVGFALAMGKMILSGNIEEVVATIEGNIRHTGEALESMYTKFDALPGQSSSGNCLGKGAWNGWLVQFAVSRSGPRLFAFGVRVFIRPRGLSQRQQEGRGKRSAGYESVTCSVFCADGAGVCVGAG